MAKYKVLVIALSVKNNKIANSGDIVDETQLNSPAYLLVQNGFIKEVEAEVETEKEIENLEVVLEEVKPVPTKLTKPKVNK